MTLFFETEHLIVRAFTSDDLDAFAALCADPLIMRYISDGEGLPRETVAHWIDVCQQKYRDRGFGTSAVVEKLSGRLIGWLGVVRAPDRDFDELTYAYHPESWGKGYATEAGAAMLAYVFARASLDRIYAVIHADNEGSVRVIAKLGMNYVRRETFEGEADSLYFAIDRPAQD